MYYRFKEALCELTESKINLMCANAQLVFFSSVMVMAYIFTELWDVMEGPEKG